ncbi:hypothetical protein E2C01_102196 [Portunus trituberculatus]|uniref:Uncharacterized protein n=1 Tax=Portunus trituberculatus TaxID=210409 RepID=A0A5B7KHX2_PORTR|nr:hypothetical protein [Portunus trituberculatus]
MNDEHERERRRSNTAESCDQSRGDEGHAGGVLGLSYRQGEEGERRDSYGKEAFRDERKGMRGREEMGT